MSKPILNEKQKKILGIILLGLFLLACTLLGILVGRPMVRFVSSPELFRAWVDAHGLWSRLAFVGMMVFQVVLAAIPGEPLELGAGYAFGAVEGTLLCVLGTTLGGLLVFGLVRRFGTALVELFFSRRHLDSLQWIHNAKKLNLITFFVFFIPGTPKDLLTYFVGLTPIRFRHYFWITAVARIPSILTSTLSGDALGGRNYLSALVAFAVMLALSGSGFLLWKLLQKHHARRAADAEDAGKTGDSD